MHDQGDIVTMSRCPICGSKLIGKMIKTTEIPSCSVEWDGDVLWPRDGVQSVDTDTRIDVRCVDGHSETEIVNWLHAGGSHQWDGDLTEEALVEDIQEGLSLSDPCEYSAEMLDAEQVALANDRTFYLECMNNKLLRNRRGFTEVRDGYILYNHIYVACSKPRD